MDERIVENEQVLNKGKESAAKHETEKSQETSAETKEENVIKAAELLEDPSDGSFMHGLQVFVAWVNNLLGK
jgi:hypothetical protein